MIVLGLDPGTATTGYGIIKRLNDGSCECLDFGCIKTSKELEPSARLANIRENLRILINTRRPEKAAIEQLFFTTNAKTALSVAQARGVVLETLHSSNITIAEFTPLQVKQAVTGYGKADKTQVQKMVALLLKLRDIPRPDDAADALAVAICAANTLIPYQMLRD